MHKLTKWTSKPNGTLRIFSEESKRIQNLDRVYEYDAFGFDLDHTLARYRLLESWELIKDTVTDGLIKKGYPLEKGTYKELGMQKMLITNPIIDFQRGIVLKTGENGKILRAIHGEERVSRSKVISFELPTLMKGTC